MLFRRFVQNKCQRVVCQNTFLYFNIWADVTLVCSSVIRDDCFSTSSLSVWCLHLFFCLMNERNVIIVLSTLEKICLSNQYTVQVNYTKGVDGSFVTGQAKESRWWSVSLPIILTPNKDVSVRNNLPSGGFQTFVWCEKGTASHISRKIRNWDKHVAQRLLPLKVNEKTEVCG